MRRNLLGCALLCVLTATAAGAEQRVAPRAKAKAPQGAAMVNPESAKSALVTLGFDGKPSTLIGCAGGRFYNTHALGFTAAGTRLRIDILSGDGIDPVATAALLEMGAPAPDAQARMSYFFDDDSGGNLDPRLEFTTQHDGNVVLSVGSFDGAFGCYWVKIEVTIP
jgi:hypothetical protein